MNKNVFVAIAFLALAILTQSCEVLVEVKPVTFMFVQNAQSSYPHPGRRRG